MKTEIAVLTRTCINGVWWFTVWHEGRMRGKFIERELAEHLKRELSAGKLKSPMYYVFEYAVERLGSTHYITEFIQESMEQEAEHLQDAFNYGKNDSDYFFDAKDFYNRTYVTIPK